jgi:hypothetical protein
VTTARLDSPSLCSYIAALVFGACFLVSTPVAAGNQLIVKGAVLPSGSQQVGEDRYKSPSNYKDTLTWLDKQYRSNPRKTIVNQPGIRGIHIVNDSGKGEWEGLNVYELDGETRFFVVSRTAPAKDAKPDGKAK